MSQQTPKLILRLGPKCDPQTERAATDDSASKPPTGSKSRVRALLNSGPRPKDDVDTDKSPGNEEKQPSDQEIEATGARKFGYLIQQADKGEGLTKLAEGGLKLLAQKWNTLVISTELVGSDSGAQRRPKRKGRLAVVYVLYKICMAYWHMSKDAVDRGYTVDASRVDDEWVPLLEQILELGDTADAAGQEDIELTGWWVDGLGTLLDLEELEYRDVDVREESSDEDNEEEEDDSE